MSNADKSCLTPHAGNPPAYRGGQQPLDPEATGQFRDALWRHMQQASQKEVKHHPVSTV